MDSYGYEFIQIMTSIFILLTIGAIYFKILKNSTTLSIAIFIALGIQLWAITKEGESLGILSYLAVAVMILYLIKLAVRRLKKKKQTA